MMTATGALTAVAPTGVGTIALRADAAGGNFLSLQGTDLSGIDAELPSIASLRDSASRKNRGWSLKESVLLVMLFEDNATSKG